MRRTGGAGAGRMARWLLLACTLFGLAAMHTLGHAGIHEPADGPAGVHAMIDGPVPQAGRADAAEGDGCAGDGCTHLVPLSDGAGGMAGWSVCVAVLIAFAVLVLLTVLLWVGRNRREAPGSQRGGGAGAARGPPPRQLGLSLATASVLRI